MKEYKKPVVEVFEIRAEESIAAGRVKVNSALVSLYNLGEDVKS